MPGTKVYFDAFEELMKELDGRPHWAKAFKMSEVEFRQTLPHWDDFKRVRAEMDPTSTFSNAYLNRLFPTQKQLTAS
jgi:FAD/FMN-containing dehydrogenase